jgi:hypothetical protein
MTASTTTSPNLPAPRLIRSGSCQGSGALTPPVRAHAPAHVRTVRAHLSGAIADRRRLADRRRPVSHCTHALPPVRACAARRQRVRTAPCACHPGGLRIKLRASVVMSAHSADAATAGPIDDPDTFPS